MIEWVITKQLLPPTRTLFVVDAFLVKSFPPSCFEPVRRPARSRFCSQLLVSAGFADWLSEGQRGDVERALPHRSDHGTRSSIPPCRCPWPQGQAQASHCSQVSASWHLPDSVFLHYSRLSITRVCLWRFSDIQGILAGLLIFTEMLKD